MASGMNKVFLMGNLGADPELRHHPTGDKLSLRLATTEKFYDKHDRTKLREVTHWHTVSLWGNRAAPLARVLSKGDRIVVEGRLESHNYEDPQGNPRVFIEVNARDVMLAGGPRRNQLQPPPLPTSPPESLTMVSARPSGEALRQARP